MPFYNDGGGGLFIAFLLGVPESMPALSALLGMAIRVLPCVDDSVVFSSLSLHVLSRGA